ncbi:MAG: 50S ribosomal protein L11 methyltransferase [Dysgonamonadaceae bacterium]|jgi:ribosomal protein L11 methyltransferase|nr:50S ribosomal protein L11 methyltransferase [Dysgonamonadaceae bacterium]
MDYYEIKINIVPNTEINRDIIAAILADIGYESFVESGDGLNCFIPENLYSQEMLDSVLNTLPLPDINVKYSKSLIKEKNWNEEWEKHFFQPVIIDNQVIIHSVSHNDIPKLKYDIVINPEMTFGTGNHATTAMMVSCLLELDLNNRSFLDMGCGTAVLAILAKQKGANPVIAIDNDARACQNSIENIRANHITGIEVKSGSADLLINTKYDIIFANINRNTLLNDAEVYSRCLNKGSFIFVSGFYKEDKNIITEKFLQHQLKFVSCREKDNWMAMQFVKDDILCAV